VRCITSPTARFFGGLGIEGAGGSKQQRIGRVRRRKLSTQAVYNGTVSQHHSAQTLARIGVLFKAAANVRIQ